MTTDLLIAIVLTAAAAFVVWTFSAALPGPRPRRIKLATALVAWFAVIVALGATRVLAPETLGTPAVGLVVVLPVVAFAILGTRIAGWREALMAIPLPALVAAHAVRVLGIFFLILHAQGRLPAPFAPIAGWGDIIIGATALPVAWMAATAMPGWRPVTLTLECARACRSGDSDCARRDVGPGFAATTIHRRPRNVRHVGAADASHSGLPGARPDARALCGVLQVVGCRRGAGSAPAGRGSGEVREREQCGGRGRQADEGGAPHRQIFCDVVHDRKALLFSGRGRSGHAFQDVVAPRKFGFVGTPFRFVPHICTQYSAGRHAPSATARVGLCPRFVRRKPHADRDQNLRAFRRGGRRRRACGGRRFRRLHLLPPSPRNVALARAAVLAGACARQGADRGVHRRCRRRRCSRESPSACARISCSCTAGRRRSGWPRSVRQTGRPVMKAIGVAEHSRFACGHGIFGCRRSSAPRRQAAARRDAAGRPRRCFDWSILQGFAPPTPWFLSGGLNAGQCRGRHLR